MIKWQMSSRCTFLTGFCIEPEPLWTLFPSLSQSLVSHYIRPSRYSMTNVKSVIFHDGILYLAQMFIAGRALSVMKIECDIIA